MLNAKTQQTPRGWKRERDSLLLSWCSLCLGVFPLRASAPPREILFLILLIVGVVPLSGADAPLADAAEKKDWAAVAALVEKKIDASAAQADGMTALHWAAYHEDV